MCIHHRALCPATKQIRDNVHQCFLDPGHEGDRHTCICCYRFTTEAGDLASSATQAAVPRTESQTGSYMGETLPGREQALSGGEA